MMNERKQMMHHADQIKRLQAVIEAQDRLIAAQDEQIVTLKGLLGYHQDHENFQLQPVTEGN
jgi:hypothetical protein